MSRSHAHARQLAVQAAKLKTARHRLKGLCCFNCDLLDPKDFRASGTCGLSTHYFSIIRHRAFLLGTVCDNMRSNDLLKDTSRRTPHETSCKVSPQLGSTTAASPRGADSFGSRRLCGERSAALSRPSKLFLPDVNRLPIDLEISLDLGFAVFIIELDDFQAFLSNDVS